MNDLSSRAPGRLLMLLIIGMAAACGAVLVTGSQVTAAARPKQAAFGIASRTACAPYLHMPQQASGTIPPRLSRTGVFKNLPRLEANDCLISYDLVVPFWSDGADKQRWIALPRGQIEFAARGNWTFPAGTVFVKTFELPTDTTHPAATRRLETRLLVRDGTGGVYGVVYKWRADNSDADLLGSASLSEDVPIQTPAGPQTQTWYYPSREDCLTCHTARAGGVLGLKTRQLNRNLVYPSGVTDNELRTWNHLGLFEPALAENEIQSFPKLAAATDASRSVEDRARSYLDANCSHCHQPGGTVANFDARYDTPLSEQGLIDGPVLIDQRIDKPRVIAPQDIWRSIAYLRTNTTGDIRMPPLARETVDHAGVDLLRQWIMSLPGRAVVAPPQMRPEGGHFVAPVEVLLDDTEPGADIHYTLDGTSPTINDARYEKPLMISEPTVVRARAFKEGFTRSVAVQSVYIVGR